jgi:hypothetical protein
VLSGTPARETRRNTSCQIARGIESADDAAEIAEDAGLMLGVEAFDVGHARSNSKDTGRARSLTR